jgi:hypothetical protein
VSSERAPTGDIMEITAVSVTVVGTGSWGEFEAFPLVT